MNMLGQVTDPASRSATAGAGPRRVAVLTHIGRPAASSAATRLVEGLQRGRHRRGPSRRGPRPPSIPGWPTPSPRWSSRSTSRRRHRADGRARRRRHHPARRRVGASTPEIPLLGVNLGHVGFLAEAESSEIDSIVDAGRRPLVHGRGAVHHRGDAAATATPHEVIWSSYAINEVSIEKAARERMLEVLVEVDGRPLSRWACDGMLVATPTGSTAYAFSAGGPVIWPGVDALLVVPLSAHALFARPLVLGPDVDGRGRADRRVPDPRRGLVRRPPVGRAAHRDGDRGHPGAAPAAAGPALRGAVHRPAGQQVRAAGRGLARARPRPSTRSEPVDRDDRPSCGSPTSA